MANVSRTRTNVKVVMVLLSVTVSLGFSSGEILKTASRKKRNFAQLGFLVDRYTPYSSSMLLQYGNWCGLGGDRSHDGSYVDECDHCCKNHDNCYNDLLQSRASEPLEKSVNDVLYQLQVFGGHKKTLHFAISPNKIRRCVPYVDIYKFQTFQTGRPICIDGLGYCSRKACQCDVDFANCLYKAKCS